MKGKVVAEIGDEKWLGFRIWHFYVMSATT
jgi:hypothetical protein